VWPPTRSGWIGLACNVALWRAVRTFSPAALVPALLGAVFITGASIALLSLLGWRRTLKKAATLTLLLAALAAAAIWIQDLPIDANLFNRGLRVLLVPSWPALLRWQMPALLALLGLLPMLWVWGAQLRRLPGPQQLAVNATGTALGAGLMAVSAFLLR
jgi:lipid A ethanolaminephosphotransferase